MRVRALDHDFQPDTILMPVGIVVPKYGELTIFFIESKATADCLVDMVQAWWDENRESYPSTRRLLIQQDNGPENNTHRSQYMHRMVQFADDRPREERPCRQEFAGLALALASGADTGTL